MIDNIYFDFLVIVVVIHIYGILLYALNMNKDDDILIKIRSPVFSNFLNGWCITHFIFFTYIGYKYPDYLVFSMVAGASWEIYESMLSKVFVNIFPEVANKIDPDMSRMHKISSWCYSSYEDIIMNYLGFIFGRFLRKYLI